MIADRRDPEFQLTAALANLRAGLVAEARSHARAALAILDSGVVRDKHGRDPAPVDAIAPTKLQIETLEYMRGFIDERGMPPTIRELRDHFGVSSTYTIATRLAAMEKKGLIRHTHKASRSWRPA